MRLLFIALVTMLTAGIAVHWALHNPGYAFLAWGHWSVELTLIDLVIAIIFCFVVLYVTVRLIARAWRAPHQLASRLHSRRSERARRGLIRGLIELAEGRWKESERLLIRNASSSQTPLLNFLAAARSAQMQQAYSRRDQYLRRALKTNPQAQVAVELTQAELQLAHGQTELALATLNHLREIAPDHAYVLKLLGRLYLQLKDWEALAKLLPKLRRTTSMSSERVDDLEIKILTGLFERQTQKADLDRLKQFWEALPRKSRSRPELIRVYADHLIKLEAFKPAEALLSRQLNHAWNDDLAARYGFIKLPNANNQLKQAETWLRSHPHSAPLLLSLARISRNAQLWGKSRTYYEASLSENPSSEAYLELGELLEQIGEKDSASNYYHKGLRLLIHGAGNNTTRSLQINQNSNIKSQISERLLKDVDDIYTA
ncbi:heme biosynthesis HemY N-terminal domain-containing protein [Acidihalobacter prosperus]